MSINLLVFYVLIYGNFFGYSNENGSVLCILPVRVIVTDTILLLYNTNALLSI